MTTEVVEAPAQAAAPAAPAAPVAQAPVAPSTSALPAALPTVPESLIHDAPGAAPAAAPTAAPPSAAVDPFAELLGKVPEKFHVKGEGDKLDPAASLVKALEHRDHLEKRLGAGQLPPKTAAEYAFTPPDEFKDLEFDQTKTTAFKEGAHKLGFTPDQYAFAMQMHLESVPSLMEGAAALTASQARAELQKVWPVDADLQQNIGNAQRALRGLPPAVIEATRGLGTDPGFLQAMAHYGAQMREDTPPSNTNPSAPPSDVQALQKSPAYLDPKHPNHASVSQQVRQFYDKAYGTAPI